MFTGGFPGFSGFSSAFHGGDESDSQQQSKEVENKKLYEILGVESTANINDIKKAYKKACIRGEYRHPDKGGDPEKVIPFYDQFKMLNEAYDILSNPEKKDIYDRFGMEGIKNEMQSGGGDPFDIFSSFFGGSRKPKGPVKAKARLQEIHVTLEDVFVGKLITFDFKRKRPCTECEGRGGDNVKKCSTCRGAKVIEKMVMLGPGMYTQSTQVCPDCKGQGEKIEEKDKCLVCKGNKIVEKIKKVEVPLECGVPNEYDYVFTGEGDEAPGIMAGDLYVRIQIKKHKQFTRKGADLIIEKKISLFEALTGVDFELTHLDGQKIRIQSAPQEIIGPSSIKTVQGQGMPFFKDQMSRGNLFIKFEVLFPTRNQLTDENIQQLRKILPQSDSKKAAPGEVYELLEDLNENDLNPNPQGGRETEEDSGYERGAQRVQCAQQ